VFGYPAARLFDLKELLLSLGADRYIVDRYSATCKQPRRSETNDFTPPLILGSNFYIPCKIINDYDFAIDLEV
jgi:hypothetical protein